MTAERPELDALSTEELRERAFDLAQRRHDVRFFWNLVKHLPAAGSAAGDDSFAGPGAAIADFLQLWRELRGEHVEAAEPMLRAAYLDYLATHSEG